MFRARIPRPLKTVATKILACIDPGNSGVLGSLRCQTLDVGKGPNYPAQTAFLAFSAISSSFSRCAFSLFLLLISFSLILLS